MKIQIEINSTSYSADLSNGKSIAITLLPNGEQPNHFDAPECTSETLVAGDFIGDTRRGGSCNVNQLSIIPHCNGTHTESVSHVINELIPVYRAIEDSIFTCVLVTFIPSEGIDNTEHYLPGVDAKNKIITRKQLESKLNNYSDSEMTGLVIRTLPNSSSKKSITYDDKNYPVFLTNDAMSYLVERKVKHLLVDFPSIDKMYDHGMLSNHRIFWNLDEGEKKLSDKVFSNKTITEMVYVDDSLDDGLFLCNLQIPEINTDAVPSRPELYRLEPK